MAVGVAAPVAYFCRPTGGAVAIKSRDLGIGGLFSVKIRAILFNQDRVSHHFSPSGTAILPEIRVREPGSGGIDWQDRTGSRITGHTGTHVSAQPGQLLRKADPQVALNLRRHSTVYYRCGGT